MGDYILSSLLIKDAGDSTCGARLRAKQVEFQGDEVISEDEASSLACSAVSKEFPVCRGCQGYSQMVRYYVALPCIQCKYQFHLSYALTLCVMLYPCL